MSVTLAFVIVLFGCKTLGGSRGARDDGDFDGFQRPVRLRERRSLYVRSGRDVGEVILGDGADLTVRSEADLHRTLGGLDAQHVAAQARDDPADVRPLGGLSSRRRGRGRSVLRQGRGCADDQRSYEEERQSVHATESWLVRTELPAARGAIRIL